MSLHSMPKAHRQIPRWKDVKSLLGFERIELVPRQRRLSRAITIDDLRESAMKAVPRAVFDYVDGAAESEISARRNREVFDRVRFRPTVLRDVSSVDLTTSMLGDESRLPFAIAPISFTRMVHCLGESAVAWAANQAGIPCSLATLGTVSPEEIRRLTEGSPRWFQLYLQKDREASLALMRRVSALGYTALIVTVDTAVVGAKRRDIRSGLTVPPKLTPRSFVNMSLHPKWWLDVLTTPPLGFEAFRSGDSSLFAVMDQVFDQSLDFDALEWIRNEWSGKLVIKGILSVDDARRVIALGADAIVVSNHGGRQLDKAVSPFEVIAEFRRELGQDVEIILDSGIRTGADIVASIAMGANSCLIGRAYAYGLMAGGSAGVLKAITILEDEVRHTLQLLGVRSLDELRPEHVEVAAAGRVEIDPIEQQY